MSVGEMYPRIRNNNSNSNLQEIETSSPLTSPLRNFSPGSRNSSPGRSNDWHRTSFKIGKAKPSKTRYMTKAELVGVVLSSLLSMVFALSIVAMLYFGTPIVMERFSKFFDFSFSSDSTSTQSKASQQSAKRAAIVQEASSKALKLTENINLQALRLKHINKQEPLLFTVQTPSAGAETCSHNLCSHEDIIAKLQQLGNESITLCSMRQIYEGDSCSVDNQDINYNIQEYATPGFSLNTDILEDHSYFVSDHNLASKLSLSLETSSDLNDSTMRNLFQGEVILNIGKELPTLSGTPFHAHKSTINYLVSGKKHWVMFRYDHIPSAGFNPLHNLHHWMMSSNDSTIYHDNVIHIFQEAGQYVFVPEGWYHATQTLSSEGSISVTYRAKKASAGSFMQYLLEGKDRIASSDYQGSIRLLKLGLGINRNALILEQLAEAQLQSGSFLATEELLRELIQINPRNAFAYSKLINLMINHSHVDVSESISELLDQANLHGIRQDVLSLSHDNL